MRCWGWARAALLPGGWLPPQRLGQAPGAEPRLLAPPVRVETGCQVRFHSNHSPVKMINVPPRSCPVCSAGGTESSRRQPERFGGKSGLDPGSGDSMIHKPRFACKWGEGREGCVGFWAFNGRRLGCTQAEGGSCRRRPPPRPPFATTVGKPRARPSGGGRSGSPASGPQRAVSFLPLQRSWLI